MKIKGGYLFRSCYIKEISCHQSRLADSKVRREMGRLSFEEKEGLWASSDWLLLVWGNPEVG